MSEQVTALYDFRGKQEFIYRTNRIKEISGASELMADMYVDFINKINRENGANTIINDWQTKDFCLEDFEKSNAKGQVIYCGGGNMIMIYKSKEDYVWANKIFSRMVLEKTYSLNAVVTCTKTTDDFEKDRQKLYNKNRITKNTDFVSVPCNVLPFTQVDKNTFQPIAYKTDKEATMESKLKEDYCEKQLEKQLKERKEKSQNEVLLLDDIADRGTDSLLAVIYIDGNAMGNKVKRATKDKTDYFLCPKYLKIFSLQTNESFVEKPKETIEKLLKGKKDSHSKYRFVVSGGDEITIICNAKVALEITEEYFKVLESDNKNKKDDDDKNYACAGIAIFHSHSPFSEMYKIAEACCESGKKLSKKKIESRINYIDFHYCRSGVTNDLETIREAQESPFTARPYYKLGDETENEKESGSISINKFIQIGKLTKEMARADEKNLGNYIIKGDSYFEEELERLKAKYNKNKKLTEILTKDNKKLLFDVAGVYDLWFAKEDDTNAGEN